MKKVAIIGFGFSGLSAAWAFARRGHDVEVFEKVSKIGGILQTENSEFGIIETAANAILRSENVSVMAKDFDITWAERKKSAKAKWVFTDKPRRWPLTTIETLKFINPMFKLALGSESIKPKSLESVANWGQRVFKSPVFVDHLLGPALQGVYANSSDHLSASLCLNTFFATQKIRHEGSHAPKKGMSDFFNSGLKFLTKHNNFKLNLNSQITNYENLDADIILDTRPDPINVNYLSVYSLTLFFRTEDRPKFQGFGCLFAKSKSVLGVLFNSDIFEDRTKEDLFSETWIITPAAGGKVPAKSAGRAQPPEERSSELDMIKHTLAFREQAFGIKSEPVFSKLTHWPQGIPNYSLQHETFLQDKFKFETSMGQTKIFKIGNYTGQIGLNKMLEENVKLARKFS